MNRKQQLLIILAAFAVLTIIIAIFAFYSMSIPPQQALPWLKPHQQNVNDADAILYMVTRTIFNTINLVLLIVLLLTYLGIYLKTRSQFTIGLLLFTSVFLIKDLAASPILLWAFGYGFFGAGPFVLWFVILPDLFELIALSVLVYLSIKY
jgi:hypothetical protein